MHTVMHSPAIDASSAVTRRSNRVAIIVALAVAFLVAVALVVAGAFTTLPAAATGPGTARGASGPVSTPMVHDFQLPTLSLDDASN